jgi:signal transduction histidine kinase
VAEQKKCSATVRLKKKFHPPPSIFNTPDLEHTWIHGTVIPNSENGVTKGLFGCITDISQFKWAEIVQARAAEAAQKAKRLQEEFIDFTSHEMRNPLSAITQCADGICSAVEEYKVASKVGDGVGQAREVLQDTAEAARTILLCASHQKRIIDDILTLSKLDSMLLSITPVAVQPSAVALSALKMFEADFLSNDIHVETMSEVLQDSVEFDWVYCDPTRLTQIFVNLLTNVSNLPTSPCHRDLSTPASDS